MIIICTTWPDLGSVDDVMKHVINLVSLLRYINNKIWVHNIHLFELWIETDYQLMIL